MHNEVRKEVSEAVADFVRRIINTQLIPAALQLNLGTLPEHLPTIQYLDPNGHADESMLNFVLKVTETIPVEKQWPYEMLNIPMPAKDAELFQPISSTPYGAGDNPWEEGGEEDEGSDDDGKEDDPQSKQSSINATDESRRLKEPVDVPGPGKCYTENCKRHGGKEDKLDERSELQLRKNKKADRARQDRTDTGKRKGEQKPASKPEMQGFSKDFGNAATRESAIAHTHELLNLVSKTVPGSVKWDDNITLEQINEYNTTMRALHERYPYVDIRQLGSIKSGDNDAFAVTDTFKARSYKPVGLVLNADHEKHGIHGIVRTKAWKQLPESERRKYDIDNPRAYNRQFVGVEKGKRTSIEDALIHEWGHAIHAPLIVDNESKSIKACKSVDAAYDKARKSGDIRNISFYAKSDRREFFAECFAARMRGETLPQYIDKMLDSVIDAAKNKNIKK